MKILSSIMLFMLFIIIVLIANQSKLKSEYDRLKANQEILLSENEYNLNENLWYKAIDSLNAVKVSELQLSLNEYKKYREQDLNLIKQLKINKSELQKVITSNTETINYMSIRLKDTIRLDTIINIADTIKYFTYNSKWTDLQGIINKDSVSIQIKNRESLKVIESVKYKRFLGFLWRTHKIKSRKIDIVSENPNTSIINVEAISLSK